LDSQALAVGIDIDLDRALRKAVMEVVDFLVEEKALTPREAFTLASLAVDFTIAEAVNETQVVAASIPKSLFITAEFSQAIDEQLAETNDEQSPIE
jgi:acetamidase/formamidase